jgi:hypothetical protein
MEAEDVELLDITPHPAVIIAEDHWHTSHKPCWLLASIHVYCTARTLELSSRTLV